MTSKGLGGIQQCLVPYSLALKKLGYEIQILVLEKSGILVPLAEHGLDAHVVPLKRGWKLFRYLPNPELKRHIQSFGPDIVIGFAQKGFQLLVEAIALLHDRGTAVECEIAGGGKAFPELARQIEARGASGYIRLVGWLGKAAKVEFLRRIDLFVSPSLNEAFGIVYLDAMQVGAPVIATPTVGARYIFSAPGSAEIVPFNDPAALAEAIARVLANEGHRTALGVNAEQNYTARFGLDVGARHLEQALRQMVALQKK